MMGNSNMANIIDISRNENFNKKIGKTKVFPIEEGKDMDDLLKTYIEKVDRDQSELREDIRESEKRTEKRIADSERRMDEHLDKIEQLIISQNDKMDDFKQKVSDKLDADKKDRHSNNIALFIGAISVLVAMVAIYYATISTITSILGLAK